MIGIAFWTGENKYGCVVIILLSESLLFLVSQMGSCYVAVSFLLKSVICSAKKVKTILAVPLQNVCQEAKRDSLMNGTKWCLNAVQVFINKNHNTYLICHFEFIIMFRFYTQQVLDIYKKTYVFVFPQEKSHLSTLHCTHCIGRKETDIKIDILALSDVTV